MSDSLDWLDKLEETSNEKDEKLNAILAHLGYLKLELDRKQMSGVIHELREIFRIADIQL